MRADDGAALLTSTRPRPVLQLPLTPFDPPDAGGDVHTALPPEAQDALSAMRGASDRRDYFVGDAWGVMLPTTPPRVPGDNTNFGGRMVMSYLLPYYPRLWQDTILRAHAERGLKDFLLDRWVAGQAGLTSTTFLDLLAYVQSWGFTTSVWLTGSNDDRSRGWASVQPLIEPLLRAIGSRGGRFHDRTIVLPGEELNNGCPPGGEGVDGIILNTCALCNPLGIPVWTHLTSNYPGYPIPERVAMIGLDAAIVEWWGQFHGKVRGHAWQGNNNEPAGMMGARLWDTRRFVGRASFDFLVAAFELVGESQLDGLIDETGGARRAWEMCCTTRTPDFLCPAVAGSMNGPRFPGGEPLLM